TSAIVMSCALSLHDALPIFRNVHPDRRGHGRHTERRRGRHRRSDRAHRRGRCRHRQLCAGARAQPGENPRRRGAGRRIRGGAVMEALISTLTDNDLVVAFALVGVVTGVAVLISKVLTRGKFQASAIAIILGLVLAYIGGVTTGGEDGLADISIFSGVGLMGGGMFVNLAIVATGFGASFDEMKKSGLGGIIALVLGVVLSFFV